MTIENNLIEAGIEKLDQRSANPLQNIHYLFIFNRAGVCLYGHNFTNLYKMNEQLISAFCSALITFSMKLVGKKIKKIDLHPLEIVLIQRQELFYGLIIDFKHDIILIEDYIDKIDNRLRSYIETNQVDIEVENIQDPSVTEYIDNIIRKHDIGYDRHKEKMMASFLKSAILKNDIEGIVLFTNKGRIIYSSLTSENLKMLLDKLDFRVKISNSSIVKLYFSTKKELIFSTSINQLYFLGVVFNIETPLGIVEYKLKRLLNRIETILET